MKLFFKDSPYLLALKSGQLYNQFVKFSLKYFDISDPNIYLMYTSMAIKYSKQWNFAAVMGRAPSDQGIFHFRSPACINVGLPHISLVAKENF